MACLLFFPIRAHPGATLNYITRKDAIISNQAQDVYRALNYMGEPDSTRRVFVYSNHCSQNPRLAEKEMRMHQELYYQSKNGAKPKPGELLALHFVQSYTKADNPSIEVIDIMMKALAEHPLMKRYASLGAHHFDKPHIHSHLVVNQFSAVGNPQKMALQKDDIYELMRFTNRLAVKHGLSIIDKHVLRKDPEYSAWVDSVIASGTVIVHEEKKIKRSKSKKSIPPKNHYYRWMKEREEQSENEYRFMTETQRRKKNFEKKYYWTPDGDENRRWYVSGDPHQRFYTISQVSLDGYLRSALELSVRFVLYVAETEGMFIKKQNPYLWLKYHAKVDKDLQGMYDYLSTAKKMNIERAEQIGDRIADVGKQMNALRQERARHEKSTEKHKQLIDAYRTYTRFHPLVEGVKEPQSSAIGEYTKAYTVLAQNQILTAEAYALLCRRYKFEKQKIVDYTKRMPLLKRQYHDLKRLEALAIHPTKYLQEIYSYSERAYMSAQQDNRSVDNIVHEAYARSTESSGKSVEEKSIDTK